MSILKALRRGKWKLLLACLALAICLHFSSRDSSRPPVVSRVASSRTTPPKHSFGKDVRKSIKNYAAFFDGLEDYAIHGPPIEPITQDEGARSIFFDNGEVLLNKEYLSSILNVPDKTFRELKISHQAYVDNHINKLIENYGISTFGNLLKSDAEWRNYDGTYGYVLIGGEEYSWLSYMVIRQIRHTGSKLPIELFIPSSKEYEADFCEKVLPKYNARCNVFDDELAKNLKKRFNISGYQYKMLALLSSKFENVLYIDSDNFPTRNIDYLFESKVFKENGLVLWPDAWGRTTNPKYYEIAGIHVTENKIRYSDYDKKQAKKSGFSNPKPLQEYTFADSHYHDFEGTLPNPTSEAGMLMVNKTSHLKTLLLCLYYNVFGPGYYYPLLTQGAAGEGDKETFIAAAHVMGEPWFQTMKPLEWIGYFDETDAEFRSKALGHYDPQQSLIDYENADFVFAHLSYPKLLPDWLTKNNELIYDKSGHHIRMYTRIYENVGYDFDLRVNQILVQGLCPDYYDADGLAVDGSGITSEEYMGRYLKYVRKMYAEDPSWCANTFIPHLKWLKSSEA